MNKKRFLALCAVFALGAGFLGGCGEGGGTSSGISSEPQVKLWSAPALEKIMRDDVIEDTDPASLTIELCKNEVEGAQFIITPENGYKVGFFDVEISELTNADGESIPRDSVKIYLQKYINVVNEIGSNPDLHAGYIPDAILPFDVAKEYGENTVKGVNQGVYVTVETQPDTAAGEYTGICTVTVDGKAYTLPVSVTVWNFAISEEVHTQSLFQIWQDELMNGELDSSDEMYEVYYDKLADYRVSATNLPGDDTLEGFVAAAQEAAEDPRISAFAMPYTSVYIEGVGPDIDYDMTERYLKGLIYASTEEVNLLDKMVYYFGALIDEPQYTNSYDVAGRIFDGINALEEKIAADLDEEGFFDDKSTEFREHMLDTLLNIPNILTTYHTPEYFDDAELTYCPLFNEFDGEENMAVYQQCKEANGSIWWYGCMGPCHPYPSYHQDDNLLGARILGIMQFDYGIDGNLYWAVNCYSKQTSGTGDALRPADPYEDASRWFPDWPTSGEGYLFYPGLDYGLDEPVASLRLESVRDGMEDYEYLYELDRLTEGLSGYYGTEITTDAMVSNLYDRLYHGVQYIPDNENFLEVRRELASLIEQCGADNKLVLNGIEYAGDSATLRFLAAEGYSVTVNGEAVSGNVQGSGRSYVYTMRMDQPSNSFEIALTKDGKTTEVSVFAGGRTEIVSTLDEEGDTAILHPNDPAVEISHNADPAYAVSGGSAKAVIESRFDPDNPLATLTYNPQISFSLKELGLEIDKLDGFIFNVYNAGETDVPLRVMLGAKGSEYQLAEYTLRKGQWTSVRLDSLYLTNWSSLASATEIILEFNNTVDNLNKEAMPLQVLYFDDVIYSEKTE